MSDQEKNRYYAVSSRRETFKHINEKSVVIAKYLEDCGYILRAGVNSQLEDIFRKNTRAPQKETINPRIHMQEITKEKLDLIEKLNLNYLFAASMPLMDLTLINVQKLLGSDLNSRVDFLIACPRYVRRKAIHDSVFNCVYIALQLGIKVYNISEREQLEFIYGKALKWRDKWEKK